MLDGITVRAWGLYQATACMMCWEACSSNNRSRLFTKLGASRVSASVTIQCATMSRLVPCRASLLRYQPWK